MNENSIGVVFLGFSVTSSIFLRVASNRIVCPKSNYESYSSRFTKDYSCVRLPYCNCVRTSFGSCVTFFHYTLGDCMYPLGVVLENVTVEKLQLLYRKIIHQKPLTTVTILPIATTTSQATSEDTGMSDDNSNDKVVVVDDVGRSEPPTRRPTLASSSTPLERRYSFKVTEHEDDKADEIKIFDFSRPHGRR